jgi:hypothetical protein
MVAQSSSTLQWHAFECKGRASVPSAAEKRKAKAQAQRLVSIGGTSCILHVGALTFFRNDAIEFYWRDPEPGVGEPIRIPDPEFAWRAYYEPIVEVIRSRGGLPAEDAGHLVEIPELDLSVGVHPTIAPELFASQWQRARNIARESRRRYAHDGFQPDGLLVRAGSTWLDRFETVEPG